MPFDVKVLDPSGSGFDIIDVVAGLTLGGITPHRVAPVRFARAVKGFSDASAPDLDDHGFTLCDGGSAHGPVVGIRRGPLFLGAVGPGPEARVKLIRDRLDPQVQLFATMEDESIAQMISPPPGDPLDPVGTSDPSREGDIIAFQATSTSNAVQNCKLFIHHGSVSGPVVAEMLIRVYPVLTIPVQAHIVSINGVAPSVTLAAVNNVFRRINAIYAQAGIEFVVTQTLSADPFVDFNRDGVVEMVREHGDDPDVPDIDPEFEPAAVLGGFVKNVLNIYFVSHLGFNATDDTVGFGFNKARAKQFTKDPRLVGVLVRERTEIEMAYVTAHEIGHVLGLNHYGGGEPIHKDMREDIWAHRCLMYAGNVLLPVSVVGGNAFQSSPARIEVGYGTLSGPPAVGHLFMTKNRAGITQSNEIKVLRDGVQNGAFRPG